MAYEIADEILYVSGLVTAFLKIKVTENRDTYLSIVDVIGNFAKEVQRLFDEDSTFKGKQFRTFEFVW